MNHSDLVTKRLINLNRRLDKVVTVEFQGRREDEPSTLSKIGRGAAVLGGGALALGGGAYLRGRLGRTPVGGQPHVGLKETVLRGANLLKGDAINAYRGAVAGVKSGAGTATGYGRNVAAQASGKFSQAKAATIAAANTVQEKLKLRRQPAV